MEATRMQQWNKEPKQKTATSEEGEDIRQDLQEDCRAGDQKVNSWIFDQSVSELEDCCNSVIVSCYCEKLVAEARDRLGTKSKGNVAVGSRYLSMASEDVIVGTSVCNSEF
jgi:hypothetical protein